MSAMSFVAREISEVAATATQCAILPLFHDQKLAGAALALDRATNGAITTALELGDFTAKAGDSLLLPGAGAARRLLLIGCGDAKKFDREGVRKFCQTLWRALESRQASEATLHLAALKLKDKEATWMLAYLARHLTTAAYRYTETLSKPKPAPKLSRLVINTHGGIAAKAANRALRDGSAIGLGINTARNLANLPGNICTPTYLAAQARKLARNQPTIDVEVLEEKKMQKLGMGALLSVAAGSAQPARLIVLHYRGGKATASPYVLVGKGITFDTGGISLKPGAKMDEMKFDMSGAASVLGTLQAAAALALPLNIIGIVAAAENMPGGSATKPGDVVTSLSGQTIEILNTDAEGRLVLCDALTYAERFKPAAVIDIATLTGACVVALGAHASGLFSKEDALAEELLSAGVEAHDRAWRMPLWEDYQEQLKSNFADVANIGGPSAGSITAACFLSRFTQKYPWAHLDIAGSAWDSSPKGATGRPVALLTRYLMDRAGLQR